MELAAIAPAMTVPASPPEINPERLRWSLPVFLLGSIALLLGMSAVPVAIVSARNFLGALAAGVGFLLGMCGLLAALARRRLPSMPVVGLVVCISATLAVALMARGPSGWFGRLTEQQAKAARPDRKGERPEEEGTREPDREASQAEPGRTDREGRNEEASKGRTRRHEEEESPAERAPKRSPPPKTELDRTIEQLKSEKRDDRVAAAERLRKMGEKARPAARALCEAIVSPSESVRRSALEALEKVDPALYKQVVLLVVDENVYNHVQASNALSVMGVEGAAAVPVLLAHAKKVYSVEYDFPHVEVLIADIAALAKLGPGEPEVVELFKELTKFQKDRFGRYRGWQVRTVAISALVATGKAQPDRRKELVPVLVAATESTDSRQQDETTSIAAIKALGEFGADAKAAIPALKKLKFSSSMPVREAARAALDKIEKDAEE